MSQEKQWTYELDLNAVEYCVNLSLVENENRLVIELTNVNSADCWKGAFESYYIEELTKKTGNFKSFPIFLNMLKTALSKSSTSVTIDLLTYQDLELLRSKKLNSINEASNVNSNNKRFLILTYSVEFDKINYPLQLNYQGKTNVNVLIDTIKKLKNVIKNYESQSKYSVDVRSTKNQVYKDSDESDTSIDCKTDLKLQKETKLLRQMIKTIEEKALKEKNLFQKQLQKKKQEVEILKNELQESRMNERNYKNEIKCLSNELRVLRQRKPSTSSLKRTSSAESFRSLTRDDSIRSFHSHVPRDLSRNSSRNNSLVTTRVKSVSPAPSNRSARSSNSIDSMGRRKFNPTEYVKNRKTKLEECKIKREREIKNRLSGSRSSLNERRFKSSQFSLNNSEIGSYCSSDNQSECNSVSSRMSRKNFKVAQKRNNQKAKIKNSSQKNISQEDRYLNDIYDANDEMKEIDAKLKSLQMLIKS
ncbi:coiled-coil domain-containing 61-like isoform X3 [Brachionus plicatilis]|uniref:Coiled-coil domain-containing 61-like isoform X3 n=1 Tax=Brachionus plicatilis TaxID=10195 RepID=A0A3M7SQ68_BRAPC|nr:coiled-coil domain-containing 61-like isoform X3 [Brachionus plicatilis]